MTDREAKLEAELTQTLIRLAFLHKNRAWIRVHQGGGSAPDPLSLNARGEGTKTRGEL